MKHTKLKKILASLTLIILLNLQGGVFITNAQAPANPIGNTPTDNTSDTPKSGGNLINPDLQPSNLPSLPTVIDANTNEEKVQLPINVFLQQIAGALLSISGALAVVIFAIGGVMYATSHGNQQQMEMAKNTLVYGAIGSLAIIFSYLIIRVVLQVIFGLA